MKDCSLGRPTRTRTCKYGVWEDNGVTAYI